ncbi:class I SAM-dependent methyltransferase [Alkalimonas amylolytica]|uniref:23S rRNA (Cytosine1962-C5)-methyltransferase n=1 Tax=Alkalimonas amylolytica TaxID=152573 RepID=A0A1H4ASI7_ALKAM|nr:class I SAM-dependent methyltransferase [Alkalimonas amylolytica]SEA38811.1 23S rRNA (cytosine1962-C5)-methyltransferase [Alkalimonas amylolytica]
MSTAKTYPIVTLAAGREKALKRRHPWIFSKAIHAVKGTPNAGDTVDVVSFDQKWLCRAAYSPKSQIRLRVWTDQQDETIDQAFFERRLAQAQGMRSLLFSGQDTTGYRLIAAESDGLPGIIIDRFADVLVCQLLSAGAEANRKHLLGALKALYPTCSIYDRSDVEVRKKEGLELKSGWLHQPLESTEVTIREHGMTVLVDVAEGHKTGFYLDQRANRLRLRQLAAGKSVLNCFSYTGTFGVAALLGGASHVINVDASDSALALSERQLAFNGLQPEQASHVKQDVFKLLRQYKEEGKQFDLLILDPPKFAENKGQLMGACRGYKDINRVAMQLVKPGGLLLTFSCSGLMEDTLFQKVVADAALDAGRDCLFVERLQQDADHPVASFYPEGHYLKGLICYLA